VQIFIAWSSDRTHRLADALAALLGDVVEGLDVFVSSTIDKGVAWPPEIRRALRDSGVGIVCLAWERRDSPWLAFEAGALARTVQFGEGRLHPYLLNLDERHVPGPLQQFQAIRTTREETRAMVASIAGQHGDPGRWADEFESAWPALALVLEQLRWLDIDVAVPDIFRSFERNTFRTGMPTDTSERLHRYSVADHLSRQLLESREAVESHCAPEVHRHYVDLLNALVEFRDNTGALVGEGATGGSRVDLIEDWRRKIQTHLDALITLR
jgi:hypothetical protein